MKRVLLISSLLLIASPAAAATYTATGLVNRVKIVNAATKTQSKLRVNLRSEAGDAKVMCKNGTTNIYVASVPAEQNDSIALVQAMLTAAMMSQHSVEIVSEWNGTYCEIQTVTFED